MKRQKSGSNPNNQAPIKASAAARSAESPALPGDGQSALQPAAQGPHSDVVQWLLQSGASVDTISDWGDTLLTIAASSQNTVLVDELIRLKADVNLTNTSGQSALMLAGNHMGIVCSLLRANADLADAANQDAVLSAVLDQKCDVAQLLLFMGASPNAIDSEGTSTLTHATAQADVSLMGCLLAAKADPNADSNQPALALALASPNPALLLTLLDAGAFPDVNGIAGRMALTNAFAWGRTDAVARWFPATATREPANSNDPAWNPLALAVRVGTPETVEMLRAAGYSTAITDESGCNLLMQASDRGQADIIRELLRPHNGQPGADPDAKAQSDGKTALFFAAQAGRPGAIKILLAAGANPNVVDKHGRTAMDYADCCTDAQQRNEVEFMLAEAMAAHALEAAGQIPLAYTDLDDLSSAPQAPAAQFDADPGGRNPHASRAWTDEMDDIDCGPSVIEWGNHETSSLMSLEII